MSAGQLQPARVRQYVTAGRARFTLHNPRTGNRFTYRVSESRDKQVLFVHVLCGPDNTTDYQYLGIIKCGEYRHGAKARISREAPSAKAFEWFWRHIDNPAPAEVFHEGRCGRCARVLTVPESVESGLGPECAGRL